MVEVKSVKVDNWGVFFLQKLQNFFNKTDYCDLTLQFKDNSQLKVHRLVLSACTDFFNVLESKYNVTDDVLVMPRDLQADVVVPIVNFMYTGTLEFEVNMYARLLKTAKDMNMTVLLKLLEAHKRTVGESSRSAPVVLNKSANQRMNTYSKPSPPPSTQQRTYTQRRPTPTKGQPPRGQAGNPVITRKLETGEKKTTTIVRTLPSTSSYLRKNLPEPVQLVAKYANTTTSNAIKGPSRFECTDDANMPDTFESSFDNISYESKPLITASQVIKEEKDSEYDKASTSFERLKRTAGPTKRGFSGSLQSPPEKKPNIQDVKEYTEAHRLRKELVAQEFEEDADYYADDFQHSNDDDEDDNEQQSAAETSGSVVIKSDGTSPVNHAKIISEVLKKYPHLVKNNKNIKLKIMQKGNQPVTVAAISKEASSTPKQTVVKGKTVVSPPSKVQVVAATASTTKTSPATKVTTAASTSATTPGQPKKIDSRTMHALIAKGAENITGPWLCLECGVNGRPISIPSYKGFRRHLINIHKQKIDPRLCEHCGWRSANHADLHYHIFIKHSIQPPKDLQFPKCGLCDFVGLDQPAIRKHKEEEHQQHSSQQHCIYCNKMFTKEIQLYSHMRNNHKKRAQEDGVMDFSDEDMYEDEYVPNHPGIEQVTVSSGSDNKIKVLSNIALPSKSQYVIDPSSNNAVLLSSSENVNLEPSSEAEGLSNVASGIATSLGVLDSGVQIHDTNATYHDESGDLQSSHYIEAAMATVHGETISPKKDDDGTEMITKFITEEGSEIQLTDAQKAELLEQLQGQGEGITDGVVMVLNDASFEHNSGEELMNASTSDQNIVLVYDEQQQSNDNSTSEAQNADDSMKDTSADQSADWSMDSQKTEDEQMITEAVKEEKIEEKVKKPVINKADNDKAKKKGGTKKECANPLISALEGDWTDDEDDDTATKSTKNNDDDDDHEVLVSTVTETKADTGKDNKPKIVDDAYDSSSNSSNNTAKKGLSKEQKASDKKLSNILDDWDSQASEKFEDDDDGKDTENESKKSKNGKSGEADDKKEGSERKTIDKKKESEVSQEKKAKSSSVKDDKNDKKSDQNPELKTLINDWGDDDNEDDQF